ncbi:MAG: hypothetical protein U9Q66_00250 [Patescibacteria group bacterium]|nr:hypothetical protein [Patescibacteria group bacterium]
MLVSTGGKKSVLTKFLTIKIEKTNNRIKNKTVNLKCFIVLSKNHFKKLKTKCLSSSFLTLNLSEVSTTGKNIRATNVENTKTILTVTGIYFIKSPILPESIKPIGINIEIVVKFHEISGFQ